MANRKSTPVLSRPGSALLLVLVVTVLLSVIGILFVMVTRLRDITSSNVADSRDLDGGIEAVTSQINKTLKEDAMAAINGTELYDSAASDPWLASLEPTWLNDNGTSNNPTDDWYQWGQITDLGATSKWDLILRDGKKTPWILPQFGGIVDDYQLFTVTTAGKTVPMTSAQIEGLPADADGDGVADSMWMKLPNLSSSRGQPVFVAVRIIDNCAMLNLNTANFFRIEPSFALSQTTPFSKFWEYYNTITGAYFPYLDTRPVRLYFRDGGRYLSEVNYYPILRGSDLNAFWGGAVGDGWNNILAAKRFGTVNASGQLTSQLPVDQVHDNVLMKIENPGAAYSLFDIGDELELRNRFLLTSKAESRIERKDVANYTLDSGGGAYAALEVPREDKMEDGIPHFSRWKWRMDSKNFDLWSGALNWTLPDGKKMEYRYDRRHICTFYSFDRNLRSGSYILIEAAMKTAAIQALPEMQRKAIDTIFRPENYRPINLRTIEITSDTLAARKHILHLLYAFREYFVSKGGLSMNQAAVKSAQIVANMIDYLDDGTTAASGPFGDPAYGSQANANPTYINKAIVDAMLTEVSGGVITPTWASYSNFDLGLTASDVGYGYEQQPFISEIYCDYDGGSGGAQAFALELVNPYDAPINLNEWHIQIGTQSCNLDNSYNIPAGTPAAPGRLTIYAGTISPSPAGTAISRTGFGLGTPIFSSGNIIRIQRPDPVNPGQFLTVDKITESQRASLVVDGKNDIQRKDTEWGFVNNAYCGNTGTVRLGLQNDANTTAKGYPLPVTNVVQPFYTLGDFQKVVFVGNQNGGTDPNTITDIIADPNTGEASIRFDPNSAAGMMGYFCTLNRDKEGNLPGRININTAPVHVIAAAIPPSLVMTALNDPNALAIARQIVARRPYKTLSDLAKLPVMRKYADPNSPVNVGDVSIRRDFEERDWIFNRLSNIFTVRSDTFTAYILVRLGTDGPQRRMIAIFDRSNVWSNEDTPRLVALHPVPDPR